MEKRTLKDLKVLTQRLRSETGCPWDRKQTIESMLKCFLDETQEVKDAVRKKDYRNLKEELGDVLFQIAMIAQIAEEEGLFDMNGVVEDIYNKIISRHTWVFGKDKAHTPEEAIAKWKENKLKEKDNLK